MEISAFSVLYINPAQSEEDTAFSLSLSIAISVNLSSGSMQDARKLLQGTAQAPPPPVDSNVVAILAALLSALICVVGLALVARCAWLRRFPGVAAPPPPSSSSPSPPDEGLKKEVLRSLPRLAFRPGGGAAPVDCPICLVEFLEEDEIRVLPHCGHSFHLACVDLWLAAHSSCPSCRRHLGDGASGTAAAGSRKCSSGPPADSASSLSRSC